MSEERKAMVQAWIASRDALRAARRAVTVPTISTRDQLASVDSFGSLFDMADSLIVSESDRKARETEQINARLESLGLAKSTDERVSFVVPEDRGYLTFSARVSETGAVLAGSVSMYLRITKAHAKRLQAQGKKVYSRDEDGDAVFMRATLVSGQWGVTSDGATRQHDRDADSWGGGMPVLDVLAGVMNKWEVQA